MKAEHLRVLLKEYGDIPPGRRASIERQLLSLQEKGIPVSEEYARSVLENEVMQYVPTVRLSEKPIYKTCANCGNAFKTADTALKYCKECVPKLREKRELLSKRRERFRERYRNDPEFAERVKRQARNYYRKPGVAEKVREYDKIRKSDEDWKIREKARLQKESVKARRRIRERERLKMPEVHTRRLESYRKFHAKPGVKEKHRKEEAARRKSPEKRERILQLQRESSARQREKKRTNRDISRFFQNWHPSRADETRLEEMINPPLVAQRRAAEKEQKRKENREKYLEEYNKRPGMKERQQNYFRDYRLRPEIIERRKGYVLTDEQKRARQEYYKKYYKENKERILNRMKNRRK